MTRARVVLVLALGAGGCGEPPRAQVVIELDAEPGVREEAAHLEVLVRAGATPDALEQEPSHREEIEEPAWPRTFALAPLGGDASRAFSFHAIARDFGGNLVAETRLIRGYTPGRVVRIRLLLEDRCRGVVCADDERCEAGDCVPADMPIETPDAGVPGADAGPPRPCERSSECDDGVFCNGIEDCVGGVCVLGAIMRCDDGLDCTRDRCDGIGCVHDPDPSVCDAAEGGVCDQVMGCQYPICNATTCMPSAGECRGATCAGTTCVRDPLCTAGEICCGGRCERAGCDDDDPCTDDTCGPMGCLHQENTAPCDDGDGCTIMDTCAFRVCRGTPLACDDGNPCTRDTCDGAGGCAHPSDPAGSCSDGLRCTIDSCVAGACRSVPMFCDDGIACTHDSCSEVSGACVATPDDSLCSAGAGGTCDTAFGCQYGSSCTPSLCLPTPGGCESAMCAGADCHRDSLCSAGQMCCSGWCVVAGCDDGNPCTNDACGSGGCTHTNNTAPCDDLNDCTPVDRCSGGTCVGSGAISCDDADPCTSDGCSGGVCTHLRAPAGTACDDGSICTTGDRCRSAGNCRGDFIDCADLEPCTTDTCTEGVGCEHLPLTGGFCEDGNFCTEGDTCDGGTCLPGPECPGGGRYCSRGICLEVGST